MLTDHSAELDMTGSERTTTDQLGVKGASGSERSGGLLREVLLPALLAAAIMLVVWWLWRVTVVDVGTRAVGAQP